MLNKINIQHSWKESLEAILNKQVLYMLLLGFSAGLPLLLIFSSLSLWLGEAGIEKSAVTYFSWAALGYSFKFVWAPLVDCLPIPLLTKKLGLRRSWLLVSQLSIVLAISIMAFTNPAVEDQLIFMALGAVLLGFSSATQDISIDAYRVESVSVNMQALVSSSYIAGYRLGMIVSGAGALYLASFFGTTPDNYQYLAWKNTYHFMSLFMLIGIIATFLIKEPDIRDKKLTYKANEYLGLVFTFAISVFVFITWFVFTSDISIHVKDFLTDIVYSKNLSAFLVELVRLFVGIFIAIVAAKLTSKTRFVSNELIDQSYLAPIKQFFNDYSKSTALLLLALIGLYRISDIVLGVISNVFYQDMGYSKTEIADAVKLFGLIMTLFGGFVGGILSMKLGVMRVLFIGAFLVVVTNLLFITLVYSGHNLPVLYAVVSMDNLVAGISSAAFVAFLSSLVNVKFTAMQYAIFSSLMTLIPKALAGYSGSIVDSLGYVPFFIIASAIGLPILILVYLANKQLKLRQT
ncbi:AmpG family muropeptide MFS transporter [Thalassotalea crassostreae]|uniref:AmpG family muropeptide MFS transporter n=1 Tax=Thalassotalea crassostreae TaxID=1763536 RepID=UPI000837F52D|nr:MFS transporter [Thalassotalea crassostreae]